ncbi:MAG: thioredoxin-dependent thiol peroxidase [Mariprofundales bacterium]
MSELEVGDLAPDFTLPIHPEGELTLSSLRGQYIVLYFYPRDNTPGCTTESCEFRDKLADFSALNVQILGISRDNLRSHKRFADKYELNFPLFADPDEVVCNLYGVMKEKNMYGKKCRGIERSTFVINKDGEILHIWRKVKVKEHVNIALSTLQSSINTGA